MRFLVAILTALALASPAAAQPHTNLGDDSIFDAPRDHSADMAEAFDAPDSLAPASQRGCVTKFLPTNFSSRNGALPKMLLAHLTVSRNVAGTGDVNGIWNFFARDATDASSNYIIDAEGNCIYAVAEDAKAWTQGSFNPTSISIEFIHFSTTDPNEKWTDAQLKKGAMVFADASKRHGIPIRLVNPSGCTTISGVTDHDRLECGNSHVDVGTQETGDGVHRGTFPMTKFINLIKAELVPPKTFVHFVLGSGEGRGLATSLGVETGPNEAVRLRTFLDFRNAAILKELRADGDVAILRKAGKP
jgi:hypothetical protein